MFSPGQKEAAADLPASWKPVWDGMGVFKAIVPIKERDTHCRTTEITGKDTAASGGGVKIKLDKRQVFREEWRLRGGGRQER